MHILGKLLFFPHRFLFSILVRPPLAFDNEVEFLALNKRYLQTSIGDLEASMSFIDALKVDALKLYMD